MPERVLLQPSPLEYGSHQEQYNALRDELEGQGILVRLLAPVQQGSVQRPAGEFYDLRIHVGEVAGAIVGTANLIAIVRRKLRGQKQPRAMPRRAKLYLPTGEEREFSLEERSSDAGSSREDWPIS